MPFTPEDAAKHTKQADTPEQKKKWADTANSVREECIAGGDDPKECDVVAIRVANEELSEADGGSPGDYLVVEDSDKPSTWHLPVKKDGKPDHKLMGAAWAALHKGYRGNKYEGPNKAEAIKKLKALYKSEDMPLPVEESAALQELWNDPAVLDMEVPVYAQSFTDFDAMEQARVLEDQIKSQVYIFERLVENIFFFSGESPETKRAAVRELVGQLEKRMFPSLPEDDEEPEPEDEEPVGTEESFAESFAEVDILSEGTIAHSNDGPVMLRVVPIQPGWGNQRDNHYYSADVLKRDAQRLIGAKMYETDHRDDEKSTRTWVSTVTGIHGFSDDGAPVAEVVVHDPVFARKVLNLNTANLLNKLECSISGEGRVRAGKIGERDGKIVDEILNIHSVDWVTRAGAGGHADAIMENEETDMTDEEVVFLTDEQVTEVLDSLNIPRQEIRERLEEGEYQTEDEVKGALDREVEYVKRLTESGRPRDMGGAEEEEEPNRSRAEILAEAEERKNKLALDWFRSSKKE
jgi:hypothetical protein